MTENLTAMDADVIDTDDGFIINSRSEDSIPVLHGAEINCSMDHRIAMTFAIAGLNADGETMITDSDCVDVSYPDFCTIRGFKQLIERYFSKYVSPFMRKEYYEKIKKNLT